MYEAPASYTARSIFTPAVCRRRYTSSRQAGWTVKAAPPGIRPLSSRAKVVTVV